MACYLPGSSISEFRIVLVGKAGSGKSASGNTILGRTEFRSAVSTSAVTKVCEKRAGVSNGRRVTVVDTPGLFNRELSEEDLKREIVRCISLSAPGPHAFLLVLQVGRFTQQERETVGLIQKLFGDGAARYIILLFTRGDDLDDTTIEEYIQRSSEGLREIAEKCGNRYHVFNNRNSNQSQVTGLLEKIESMVAANGESCYTREMYQEAESAMRQEQERMRSEREEEKRREEEEQRRKFLGEQKGTGILASGEPSPLPLNDAAQAPVPINPPPRCIEGETEEQEPAKETCEEDTKKQPARQRRNSNEMIPPETKEKCDKEEEEMKNQPEPRRRNSNEDNRPEMSGCEASAEEETGETEEQEPAKKRFKEEMKKQPAPRRRRRHSNDDDRPDPKEKCEEEMKKQPAPRRSGRRGKVKDERPNMSGCEASAEEETGETEEQEPAKEKCDKEEEMKKQPEHGRKRRRSNSDDRPIMSGREASAVEKTGETEKQEPVSGCEASAEEETGETEEQEPAVQMPVSINPPPWWTRWIPSFQMNEVAVYSLQAPEPRNRAEFLKYSCQLTLDPNTAHRNLCLSEGNRKVTQRRETQRYPDHPERFDSYAQVLCRQGLSGTRCYWEIEWSGLGALIGVTYKGISRKGEDDSCLLGFNDKSWSLLCSGSSYTARHNNNETEITAPRSPRIGVYLDFNAGTLSFYGVSDTMTLLHRFQTTFTEPLYPGFGLYYESPVTICQLN